MATLNAMFRLYDGYSRSIASIISNTNRATDRILNASSATDSFNARLTATSNNTNSFNDNLTDAGNSVDGFNSSLINTSTSANIVNNGLRRLVGTLLSLAAVKKGMDLTDTYVNTNARLSLINDGLQTQLELQNKIFAAADRAKGSYSEMADAVAKMGLLAGDAFSGNNELIAFTELIQKSFKLGGADTSEQQGAMRQLSQAMASGRLQGDEFVSISENAPLILDAISRYTKLSRGELKELSSDGAISADIIKNAIFDMGDDIEDKFKTMPMTFGDIWTKISNGATKAFRPVMESVNNLINTDGFQSLVDGLIIGINMLANEIEWLINFTIENWGIIGPILGAVASFYLVNMVTSLWAMVAPLVVQYGLWTMITSPIFLVVLAIGLIISILNDMGITVQDVFGFIGGSIGVLLTLFLNLGVAITNSFIAIAKTIDQVITGAVNLVLKGVNAIIAGLNKIPGVDIGSIYEFNGFTGGLDYLEYGSYTEAYENGAKIGENIYSGVSDKIGNFTSSLTGPTSQNLGDFGSMGKPITIEGKGKNKKVEVDIDDENIKYLRDIAERDYINKFSTATLAPQISVQFGDVHEEADIDKVANRITKLLKEEIAVVSEGVYD